MNEIEVKVTADRSRKYYIMYYVDPLTRLREQRSTKKTKRRDADREAAKWDAALRAGRDNRDGRRMTWDQFRDLYYDDKLAHAPVNTQKAFATAFYHLESLINPKMLASLTSAVMATFQRKLRAGEIAETTILSYLRATRAALNWAAKRKLLAEAP